MRKKALQQYGKYYKVPRMEMKYIGVSTKLQRIFFVRFFLVFSRAPTGYPSVVFHFVIVQLLICIVDYKVALYNIQNICCSRLRSLVCFFFVIRFLLYLCVHFKFRFVKVFFLVVGESYKLNNTAQQFLNFYFVVARSLAEPSTYITTLRSKVPIELNLQHESTTFQEFLFSYILHSYIFCKNIHTIEK